MELVDLGYEYLRRSEELINHIHNLKERCKGLCGNEKVVMKRRIYSLYSDAASCRQLALMMISYGRHGDNE